MSTAVTLDLTIALITEEEFGEYQQYKESNSNVASNVIVSFINWASAEIKEICGGRIFIIPNPATQIQEIFDGDGTKDYYTKHGQIGDTTPATDVKVYIWQPPTWTEQVAGTYPRTVVVDSGRVYFNNGHIFTLGSDNWRIDYLPGWLIANVPADLKGLCKQVVFRLIKLAEGKEGLTTESFGDSAHTYNLHELLTGDMKSRLKRYKRRFL